MPKVYTAFLVLENGQMCQGWSFIDSPVSCGEVVFNTGMTGYQEVITDPSYCDQIVLFTYPEIGNTGINADDLECSMPHLKGLIAKNVCFYPSNWQLNISLPAYLTKHQIPHIFGLDTRCLTKYLRNAGVMLGSIVSGDLNVLQLQAQMAKFKLGQDACLVDKVTTRKLYAWSPKSLQSVYYQAGTSGPPRMTRDKLSVIVVDYGVKLNILNRLMFYGCDIIVVPARTSYKSIVMQKPDGILFSNGPGDPSLIDYAILNIQKIVELNIPVFGICLGHQLLSLALGATTNKLKFGHRGLNHPSGTYDVVKMTSQNHGYVVALDTFPVNSLSVAYVNLNDKTISAIVHKSKPCFSVQYHPEASPGPHDSDDLFAHFIAVMTACKLA